MEKQDGMNTKILFRMSLQERYLPLGSYAQVDCKHIDEVGLFIYHNGEQELTPEFVRGHLIGIKESNCMIEASTVEEAINIFHAEWEATKIGGETRKRKALWLNEKVPIQGLPECKLLHQSQEKRYICGEEMYEGNGIFGMCIIDGSDPPDGCPAGRFYEEYYERERAETLPVKTVNVDGVDYPFVMAEDLFTTETSPECPSVIA